MDKGKKPMREEGNTSNPKPKKYPNPTTDKLVFSEYWPTFYHCRTNKSDLQSEHFSATCRKCYQSFKYNNLQETDWIPLELHYEWHQYGGEESEQEYLKRKERERQPKKYDWYKDYLPRKSQQIPLASLSDKPNLATKTHWTKYEKIYQFRGDHTVSCTKCGQVFNYKEDILRDHYDAHQRQAEDEQEARDRETQRVIEEFKQQKMQEKNHRENLIQEENRKKIREWEIENRKRDEERRIAASRMAEIEQQQAQADAAFWNEAAQMADNAAVSQQQQKNEEEEEEEPWWDEILKYVDSQNL